MNEISETNKGDSVLEELKISIHYSVGKICEEIAAKFDVSFTKQFIAALREITVRQIQLFAEDLELFSRHAKRTTVTSDDIKLLVRKSQSLVEHMEKHLAETAKNKKTKKKDIPLVSIDDDISSELSNLDMIQ